MNKKCAFRHNDRLFRVENMTVESCYQRCGQTESCNHFSIAEVGQYAGVCMGCAEATWDDHENFTAYDMPTCTSCTAPSVTEHGCECMKTWVYNGTAKHCCDFTDDHAEPWCYVTDGANCPDSVKTSSGGAYWDRCVPFESSAPTTTVIISSV